MPTRAPWLLPLLLAGLGCQIYAGPRPPEAALHPAARSALMGEVDEIVAALATGEVQAIANRMTARLHEQLPVTQLADAAAQLHAAFGEPTGIMEEHLSREGDLLWYSGLVIYARGPKGREVLTPVLVQLALTPTRQLERLLVREHVFVERLRPPVDVYEPVTRFHVPANGTWTVSQGGPTRELNAHHDSESQRHAYDLVLVVDGRFRDPAGARDDNASYYGYGQPLRAPAAGVVVRVVDGVPDNVPEVMGRAGGNGVVIDHGFGEVTSLWHARPGSLRVKEGDHVEAGQIVAEVGNSGRSSGAHIHVHLTRGDGDFALPLPLSDVWVDGVPRERALLRRGDRVQSRARLEALPRDDAPRSFVDR